MIRLIRRYEIEAAHRLTDGVPENHKCRRPHGHRYVISVAFEGHLSPDGMLVEYGALDRQIVPILRRIDHQDLNTLAERDTSPEAAAVTYNPTVERLVQWFRKAIGFVETMRKDLPMQLAWVRIEEDSRSAAEWHR